MAKTSKSTNSVQECTPRIPTGYRALSDKNVIRTLKYLRDRGLTQAVQATEDGKVSKEYASAMDLVRRAQDELEKAYRIIIMAKGEDPDNKQVTVNIKMEPVPDWNKTYEAKADA
jgi:intergrase/recombinase